MYHKKWARLFSQFKLFHVCSPRQHRVAPSIQLECWACSCCTVQLVAPFQFNTVQLFSLFSSTPFRCSAFSLFSSIQHRSVVKPFSLNVEFAVVAPPTQLERCATRACSPRWKIDSDQTHIYPRDQHLLASRGTNWRLLKAPSIPQHYRIGGIKAPSIGPKFCRDTRDIHLTMMIYVVFPACPQLHQRALHHSCASCGVCKAINTCVQYMTQHVQQPMRYVSCNAYSIWVQMYSIK